MTNAARRRAWYEATRPLAELLGQIRIEGDAWYFTADSDKEEPEHRVDRLGGELYCTCRGFIAYRHCYHVDRRTKLETTEHRTEIVPAERSALPALARQNPAALSIRLQDLKENRELTRKFFAEVMEEGVDFGVIPGTDKPTLFKPGAEGLCELYGYAPTYSVSETKDLETGFLRVVVTCTLIQRGTGEIVAQGLGECNTREARYFYRWMPAWEIAKYPELEAVKDRFKKEERKWRDKKTGQQKSAIFYRTENDDLFTLWNTVTKMAKKRAHVDATLSATRSSGIFSQGQAALEDWIEGEFEDVTEERQGQASAPQPPTTSITDEQRKAIIKLWNPKHDNLDVLRERFPKVFPQPTPGAVNKISELSYDEASEVLALLSEKPECKHEDAVIDPETTLMTCSRCGWQEQPPADVAPQQASMV